MAEIVLSAFLPVIFEKLGSATLKKLARSKGVHSDLNKLESSLLQINAVLIDAAQKEIREESVKTWLNGLQHLAYDIDDVLDDLATEAMHRALSEESEASTSKVRKLIPTCCTSFSLSTRMHAKLNYITTKLQDLAQQKKFLGLIERDGNPRTMNRSTETSLVDVSSIVGRQGDKEALLQMLLMNEQSNKKFSIVPIVGLGGIGKTTLAKLLYNEKQVNDHFALKAWVCVSDEFDIFKITKTIFQCVKGDKEFTDLNLLQEALREKLSNIRFLIVLDDVWSEKYAEWSKLELPFLVGAPGSKIIMTTRKLQLLTQLGYNHPYHLQNLSPDDALSLFSQHALGESNLDSQPAFKPLGEGIVKKCEGLPLALVALGRLLRTKTKEEWKELLNSDIWRLTGDIIPALRLSYLDLPAHLKQLFAYCSFFPKDYVFDKEELVLLWMAEGFLHQSTGSNEMESFGRKCFQELLSRSFFQKVSDNESSYIMHDLMNDLATFVAGDFFFRLGDEMDVDDVNNEALGKYRHMSFIRQRYGVYRKFKVLERAKSLRTLLAVSVGVEKGWREFYLSNKILFDLLPQLPLLRVLHFSDHEISEVPESIGSLKHLRYLNLSRTGISHLPEQVGKLYNLQMLLLCGCKSLAKLPRSFSKLKSLRHFDISDTPLLKKMPLGIGKLKRLQTLSKVINEGANGFAITKLKDMKDLHGRLSIVGLEKVQNAMDAEEANLLQKRLSELEMEWSDKFDGSRKETLEKDVLNVLKPHHGNLKKLKIVSYGGKEFPSWVGDPSFLMLACVKIRRCKNCTSLPSLGRLPLLKELVVDGMDDVKVVDPDLLGTGVAFPSLEILSFERMSGWEVWSTNGGVIDSVFPCLRKLRIEDCPNLVEVSLETLPSLRELDIRHCSDGVLRSLVRAASSVTKLEIRRISGLTQLHGEILKYLGAVEEVSIKSCYEMRYLWESEAEACKVLVNLRELKVWDCNNLVRLGEREEDNCGSSLPSLRDVRIWGCKNLEHYSCPNSVEKLDIDDCGSITSISFPTGGQKKLKRLHIWGCEKLLEEESSGGGEKSRVLLNTSMSLLESIKIWNWPNLKSFPSFICFIHLTKLEIWNCKNLESVPDEEFPHLTSLTEMWIQDCPSMDDSFPRGLWPPNLSYLSIGGLKKPISEWGPQHFPKSLVELRLRGTATKDVCSSSQLSHLLPSSLTSLYIHDFEKLESLSSGLQHLTSLQHLDIWNCPNLRDLPETLTSLQHLFIYNCPMITDLPKTLLPSLLQLYIYTCPKLKERCSRRGSYWPLISHIPCIRIE